MDTKIALTITILVLTLASTSSAASLSDQCTDSFQKVVPCMNFATGKATTPGKDCCESIEKIIGSQPVCLCYIIVEVHNGSESTKDLGLQETKLLQLPSACKLANGILGDCPKLLNISSTSPYYALFTNTTSSSSLSPSTGTGSSSTPATKDNSIAYQTTPRLVELVAVAMVIASVLSAPFH